MLKIDSVNSLQVWLRGQDPTVIKAIAGRVALRVLPIGVTMIWQPSISGFTWDLTLAIVRANSILRAAAKYPDRKVAKAAAAAAAGAAYAAHTEAAGAGYYVGSAVAGAAYAAARAASIGGTSATARAAARAAAFAEAAAGRYAADLNGSLFGAENRVDVAVADLWRSLEADATWCTNNVNSAFGLLHQPLWLQGQPEWFRSAADDLLDQMRSDGDHWGVWAEWYAGLVAGGELSEWQLGESGDARMAAYLIEWDDAWWKNPIAGINGAISQKRNELRRLLAPVGDPEPQSERGVIMVVGPDGKIDADEYFGANGLLMTPDAIDFHTEAREAFLKAALACRGHNQAGSLVSEFDKAADLIGTRPFELRIGRYLQTAERCVKLATAMAEEMRSGEAGLGAVPLRTREIIVALEAVPSAHWAMVNFDPKLSDLVAAMREILPGDLPGAAVEARRAARHHLSDAVSQSILTEHAAIVLDEMAEGVDQTEDPRRALRYWASVRNFGRAVISWIWKHKVGLGAGTGGVATGTWNFLRWASQPVHAAWLRTLFAHHPQMLPFIEYIVELAKMLPPA